MKKGVFAMLRRVATRRNNSEDAFLHVKTVHLLPSFHNSDFLKYLQLKLCGSGRRHNKHCIS
jgi:hypothetical protein